MKRGDKEGCPLAVVEGADVEGSVAGVAGVTPLIVLAWHPRAWSVTVHDVKVGDQVFNDHFIPIIRVLIGGMRVSLGRRCQWLAPWCRFHAVLLRTEILVGFPTTSSFSVAVPVTAILYSWYVLPLGPSGLSAAWE